MTPEQLMKEINKTLGTEALSMGSDARFETQLIRTGVLPIDVMLGGGIPRNRSTEFYGGFSTLKSYIGYRSLAATQAAGGVAALVDTEHAYDSVWAAQCGVDTAKLLVQKCETGEEAMDTTDILIRNKVDMIVWDSVAATMPQDEAKKRMGKENIQPGRQAAFMSQALRRITSVNERTALMFINQTREKVGVVFGSPETTPGGRSLPFYASHRVAMRKGKKVTEPFKVWDGQDWVDTKRTSAYRVHATLEKSKLTSPGREYVFLWDSDAGQLDEVGFAISYALEKGWITQTGKTWKMDRTSKVGKDVFKQWVAENKMTELTARIYNSLDGRSAPVKSKAGKLRRKPPASRG